MLQENRITIDREEIFYLAKPSSESKATVIFIHGFPFSSAIWADQLKALPNNIQGFAYDLNGFGKSSSSHHFFSVDLFSRKLKRFLDTLALEKVILCGLSMGGYIALRFAETARERMAGLVLCDTNWLADADESKLKRFNTIELVQSGKKAEFAYGFLKNVFAEQSFQDRKEAVSLIENIILSTSDATICGAQLALASRTDTSSVLPELDMPVLIVRGEEDKIMTEAQADQLNKAIPRSEKVVIPASGHLPNLENTDTFNNYLNQFLSKHFS